MSKVLNMVGGGGGGGPAASIFVAGLSETDTVTATNGSKTLTGKWTQKPNPESLVPTGYTQLEYIESTGTQYIDTTFIPNQDTRIVADLQFTTGTSLWGFGSRYGSEAQGFTFGYSVAGDVTVLNAQYGDVMHQISGSSGAYDKHIVDMNKNVWSMDGNTIHTFSVSTFTTPSNALLFGFSQQDANFICSGMKLYSCRIYDNGNLVRDFIPCINQDGEIGLYDLVTNAFYANSGSGTFLAGAEVPQTIDGFLIKPIRDFGTWTVTATDGAKTATQDVLVDVITEYEIEMSLSA